jgi:serine/threonine protein phosphatase 1
LGDYINRGPDSERVIQRLRRLDAVFLRGNHEERLLTQWRRAEASTQRSWLDEVGLSAASLEWLAEVPLDFWESETCLFVHGGLDPSQPRDRQIRSDYLEARHQGDYRSVTPKWVVHGHHPVSQPELVGNRINVNTGCGTGGPLTAVALPELVFLQSSPSPRPASVPSLLVAVADDELEELSPENEPPPPGFPSGSRAGGSNAR